MDRFPSGYSEPESFEHYVERTGRCIEQLQHDLAAARANSKMLLELSRTRFSEGLRVGHLSSKRAEAEYSKAKDEFLTENEKLTNLLLSAEDERDELKARIDSGIRVMAQRVGIFHDWELVIDESFPAPNATLILDEGVEL